MSIHLDRLDHLCGKVLAEIRRVASRTPPVAIEQGTLPVALRRHLIAQTIMARTFQPRVHRKHPRIVDGTDGRITSLNVMTQIGIAIGTGGMPILTTVASLFLTTASGSD
jgi:hypothetical protein